MRLTPEREKDVRDFIFNGSHGSPSDWYNYFKELIVEIDELREEIKTLRKNP